MIVITVDQEARKLSHTVENGDKYHVGNIQAGDRVVSEEMKKALEVILDNPEKYRDFLERLLTEEKAKAA